MTQPPADDPFAAPPRTTPNAWQAPAAPAPPPYAPPPAMPASYQPFVPSTQPQLIVASSYPEGYSPYMSGLVNPNAPGTVFLDVPGAAVPVYVARADGGHPELYVGVRRVTGGFTSSKKVKVPLIGGGVTRLKWVENWPGFPVASIHREKIYQPPGLTGGDRAAMLVARLAPLVLGLIPGYFAGYGLAYWMAIMIKRGDSTVKRRLVPVLIALSAIALVALYIAALVANPSMRTGY